MKAFEHNVRPHAPRGAELGNLLKQVVVTVKEEGKLAREPIYIEARVKRGLDVANGVREGEGHLLHSRCPGFTDVVATDTDRVPTGQMLAAVAKQVGDDAHR